MEAFGRQIADARDKAISQQRRGREDEVSEAACIGVLLFDRAACVTHQQPIQDIRRFIHRRRNVLGGEGTELI